MVSPRRRSSLQIGAFIVLIINETVTLSSSALSFRDQFRSLTQAPRSQSGRRKRDEAKGLHVAADIFDSISDSNEQKSDIYSAGEESTRDGKNSKNILTFQSSFSRQSTSSVKLSPDIDLDEFFSHNDHILSAGKSVHSKIVPTTPELLEDWTIACDRAGACLPNNDHGVIMSVRTAGISIPGLSVEWSALIGTNLVHRYQKIHNQSPFPELEFVLIKDETTVSSGAKPIIWIYNKLSRNQNKSLKNKRRRRSTDMDTKLFTRLGFYKENSASLEGKTIDNGDNESFVIRCEGMMEMKFGIPSMLGKLIFSSNADEQKAKAERKISNLITRQIEKDCEQNVLRWEENFRVWTKAHCAD